MVKDINIRKKIVHVKVDVQLKQQNKVDCPVTLTVKKIFHFLEFEIHENEKNKKKKKTTATTTKKCC